PPPPDSAISVRLERQGLKLKIVRHPRARRYLLRLAPDGVARLIIPRRGSRAEALRFLEQNEAWLLKRFRHWQSARRLWIHGTAFLFRGEPVTLEVTADASNVKLRFADQVLDASSQPDYRLAVLGHLRRIAERELPRRVRELAQEHGITLRGVTVRNQKTRWGSCSARGTISLNWRIIQAPVRVRDYLIIHELMHRKEMNHSPRYWKRVAAAFPDYREAEAWLKRTRLDGLD
ncbi:MAG: M48 family metallopeptidase, partial [Bryobacteraceae bacterium]